MRRAAIDEQDRMMITRQREFRAAADIVADAWAAFPEVRAVAVIGSVARPLWREVPRFRGFRSAGIEVWHECQDLDLAVWIANQTALRALRSAAGRALRTAFEAGTGMRVAETQLDIFLVEPSTDRYLGRLCKFNACPKGKLDCLVPGCGTIPFNKRVDGFEPRPDLLAPARYAMLYERGAGRLRSALDLPEPGASLAPPA
jgi:hypothetical protein